MLQIYGARLISEEEHIYTVFPKNGEMPQDFESYREAQKSGDEEFGRGNYVIESSTDY